MNLPKNFLNIIPALFKSKFFLVCLIAVLLFVLLAPFGVMGINKKVSDIINRKAELGISRFERETGVRIRWKSLRFNLLLLRVELKEVFISNARNTSARKNLLFDFLNGPQFLDEVSLRPRIFYSYFKKKLHLSSVKARGGEFRLKTAVPSQKKLRKQKTLNLPIQRLLVKNTNLHLKHKENELLFSRIHWDIWKTGTGDYKFQNHIKSAHINQIDPFELTVKGRIVKNRRIFIKHIAVKNKTTDAKARFLNILFDAKGLKRVEIQSSGILSSSAIQELSRFFHQRDWNIEGAFSYNLHLLFIRRKGLKGNFIVRSRDSSVQNTPLKTLFIKGKISNRRMTVENGFIETKGRAELDIKKLEILYSAQIPAFTLSVQGRNLSSDLILKKTREGISAPPIKSLFSGSLDCAGAVDLSSVSCKGVFRSPKTEFWIGPNPGISFHNMEIAADGTWKDKTLSFNVSFHKDETTQLTGAGRYESSTRDFAMKFNGASLLGTDTNIAVPFPLKGPVQISRGVLEIKNNKLTLNGRIFSRKLNIHYYTPENITGTARFKNKILSFGNITGQTGDSAFEGSTEINFREKKADIKVKSDFFDIKDLKKVIRPLSPLRAKGTGLGSLHITLPFSRGNQPEFTLSGHLFNTQINKESFRGIDFDINFKNQTGTIQSLVFRKGKGLISGQGRFDKNFNLHVNLKGIRIPLERIQFLNAILPFHQSGVLNFSGQLKGPAGDPEFKGTGEISNASFYTHSADNSLIEIILNKRELSLSGNLMNELLIEKLSYRFQGKQDLRIKAKLRKWDFINLALAKSKKENLQKFSSELSGEMDLNIQNKEISGLLKINDLLISQGNKWMKSDTAFSIWLTPEKWTVTPAQLSHHNNTVLKIQNRGNNRQVVSGHTDLTLWAPWFPFFSLLEGTARVNFSMNENIKLFRPEGRIVVRNGFVSLPPLPGFKDIRAVIDLNQDKIILTQFESRAGEGQVTGRGTAIYSYGKSPPAINFVLNFSDSQINIPKGFYTTGDGFVIFSGKQAPYSIKGDYVIDSGNIVRDWSASKESDFINNNLIAGKKTRSRASLFHLDLKIRTKAPLLIKNSTIQAPANGTLRVHGPLKELKIDGSINLDEDSEDNGVIIFRGREFKIRTASVIFEDSPPDNPFLNVTAETVFEEKVPDRPDIGLSNAGGTVNSYRISLSVEGPSKNPQFSLSSIPALNKKEIISLLAFGMASRYFDENIEENLTQYSYQFIGSYLLDQPLGKELKNTLNMDLSITPHLSAESDEPATKLTVKKNWRKNLQTSLSRTIEDKPVSDARVKYQLKKNMSLTAFWENTEKNPARDDGAERDTMGLDFEFSFEF